jgi:hypothetical protein
MNIKIFEIFPFYNILYINKKKMSSTLNIYDIYQNRKSYSDQNLSNLPDKNNVSKTKSDFPVRKLSDYDVSKINNDNNVFQAYGNKISNKSETNNINILNVNKQIDEVRIIQLLLFFKLIFYSYDLKVKEQMKINLANIIDRDKCINKMEEKVQNLNNKASFFEKLSGKIKSKESWKNMKWSITNIIFLLIILFLIGLVLYFFFKK